MVKTPNTAALAERGCVAIAYLKCDEVKIYPSEIFWKLDDSDFVMTRVDSVNLRAS